MMSVNAPRRLAGSLGLLVLLASTLGAAPPTREAPPARMLWAWYRAEDFRAYTGAPVGVAYFGLSLRLEGTSDVVSETRAEPVRIPPKMYQMAVVRFDDAYDTARKPTYSARQRELAVRMIAEFVELARPQALQIDFDAPRSARPFYRQLLTELRAKLPSHVFLSMTALVSWCGSASSWLGGLPVDEIVPMAFSMGQATPAIMTMLQRGGQFAYAGCRSSIGIQFPYLFRSLADPGERPIVRARSGQRAYYFPNYEPWSPERVEYVLKGGQR